MSTCPPSCLGCFWLITYLNDWPMIALCSSSICITDNSMIKQWKELDRVRNYYRKYVLLSKMWHCKKYQDNFANQILYYNNHLWFAFKNIFYFSIQSINHWYKICFIVYTFYFIFAPTTCYCYENVFNITTTISVIISIRLFKEMSRKIWKKIKINYILLTFNGISNKIPLLMNNILRHGNHVTKSRHNCERTMAKL